VTVATHGAWALVLIEGNAVDELELDGTLTVGPDAGGAVVVVVGAAAGVVPLNGDGGAAAVVVVGAAAPGGAV
jgi:hypothetical protein